MELQEFSLGFDLLWNNIMSNQAPGLSSYEKSLFLTKAQEEILKNYFNPAGNKYMQGFDMSRKREIDFSMLVTIASPIGTGPGEFSQNSFLFSLPEDIFFILNESCKVKKGATEKSLVIVPISYTEYMRLMNKTYKAPYKWQCWRVFSQSGETATVELIPGYGYDSCEYSLKYIRHPKPIILEDLTDGLTIDGESTASECELNKEIHSEILQRAVEIAKLAWLGNDQAIIEVGKRSE